MMRCRQVAELLTSDRLRDASFRIRLQVKLHLWMCRHCARLARQMALLRVAASKLASSIDGEKTGTPGDEFETRLLQKLSRKD